MTEQAHARPAPRLALMLVVLAAATVPCRLFAQGSTDSSSWRLTVTQVVARADSLARGDASDRLKALDLLRQAQALFERVGARASAGTILDKLGVAFARFGQLDSALARFREALPIVHVFGDRTAEMETLTNIGATFVLIGQGDSALAYNRRASSVARAIGDRFAEGSILGAMGIAFREFGHADSALFYQRRSLALRRIVADRTGEATTLANIGLLFTDLGLPDSALAYDRQALPILRADGGPDRIAGVLQNMGYVFENVGQADSASAYIREALSIARTSANQVGIVGPLLNIGAVLLSIGQSDSALMYFRQALRVAHSAGDRADEATALGDVSVAFSALGQPDSSLAASRLALAIRRAVGDRVGEAGTLRNIAEVFYAKRQRDSALAYERQSLLIERAVGNRLGEGVTLRGIGGVFALFNEPDSALMYSRLALPIEHAAADPAGEATTLQRIAAAFRSTGRTDSATAYYDRATALYASISKRTGGEFNQLSYNETTARAFAGWMLTWTDVVERGDSRLTANAGYAALAAAERGRAQALRQLMATARDVPVGADLGVEGRALAARIVRSAAAALVYSASGDTLVIWLIPAHGTIITSVQRVSQTQLDTLVAAMRYGVAGSDTRPNRGRGDPLDPTTLPADVIVRALADSGRTLRRDLAKILLPAAIRDQLPASGELIVVPYGGLSLIPFGLLPVDSVGAALLGDRLALRYGPSLTAIIDAEDRTGLDTAPGADRARQLVPALIVGDPTMPPPFRLAGKSYALSDLPAARDEGRAVADSLGAPQWLTGDRATEAAVRDQLGAARLVHLATHGIVFSSDAHTRLSFVALAPDSQHDGHLSVGTILDSLSLHAELVVLSACQTAVGDIKSAEGTLGLQRAMLAKGARSVLVSLWNVSDVATLFLVQRFYHHWLHDPSAPTKSEALRLAQADVRAEGHNPNRPDRGDWGDPFYWAAFQLVGAP